MPLRIHENEAERDEIVKALKDLQDHHDSTYNHPGQEAINDLFRFAYSPEDVEIEPVKKRRARAGK